MSFFLKRSIDRPELYGCFAGFIASVVPWIVGGLPLILVVLPALMLGSIEKPRFSPLALLKWLQGFLMVAVLAFYAPLKWDDRIALDLGSSHAFQPSELESFLSEEGVRLRGAARLKELDPWVFERRHPSLHMINQQLQKSGLQVEPEPGCGNGMTCSVLLGCGHRGRLRLVSVKLFREENEP